jgi:hypothetical protein
MQCNMIVVVWVPDGMSIVADLYRIRIFSGAYYKKATVGFSVRPRFAREHTKYLWCCVGRLINIAPVCGRKFENS